MLMLLSGEMSSLCISFRLLMTLWMIVGLFSVRPSRPPKTLWLDSRLRPWRKRTNRSRWPFVLVRDFFMVFFRRSHREKVLSVSSYVLKKLLSSSVWVCNDGTCRLQPETPERPDEQSSRLISWRSHTLFWRSQYKLLSTPRPRWH